MCASYFLKKGMDVTRVTRKSLLLESHNGSLEMQENATHILGDNFDSDEILAEVVLGDEWYFELSGCICVSKTGTNATPCNCSSLDKLRKLRFA